MIFKSAIKKMDYYINIASLCPALKAIEMELDKSEISSFWKKNLRITDEFYQDFIKHEEVLLIPELDNGNEFILDFDKYFNKSVGFSINEIITGTTYTTIYCELLSYCDFDDNDEIPF